MKLVFATGQNSEGISEVFNTVTMPEDVAPASLIARWRSLTALSPLQALEVTGKENLMIGSIRDQETETYTMPEGVEPEHAKSLEETYYVFLIDNVVAGIYQSSRYGHNPAKMAAAFSTPIYIVEVDEEDPVDLGFTWDGTTFYPPAE